MSFAHAQIESTPVDSSRLSCPSQSVHQNQPTASSRLNSLYSQHFFLPLCLAEQVTTPASLKTTICLSQLICACTN